VREVEVVRERDRPVLLPVVDTTKETVLKMVIGDLIDGIKGMRREEVERNFSERVRKLLEDEQFWEDIRMESSATG
jgi:hypothetical protein